MQTAFSSDFDNTLHFGLQGIRDADLQAIARYRQAGGLFGINTGRSLGSLLNQTRGVLQLDFRILVSGALVLGPNDEPIYENCLPRDLATEVLAQYRWPALGLCIAVSNESWAVPPMSWAPKVPNRIATQKVMRLSKLPNKIYGLSIRLLREKDGKRMAESLAKRYGSALSIFQNRTSLDIVSGSNSKGEGILIAKRELGVDVMAAMGDSYNDIAQLQAADVAYTFPEAPAPVRAAAASLQPSIADALDDLMRRTSD